MLNLFKNKSKIKAKEKNEISSKFDLSHTKNILSAVASVSKAAGFPPLEAAAEMAKKIVETIEVSCHC